MKARPAVTALSTMLSLIGSDLAVATGTVRSQILAPGYTALQFPAPVVGSYTLPVLRAAADGQVVDSTGHATRLHDLMGDKAVVMNFIYTHCNDVNGCPLTNFVLRQLQKRIEADPILRNRVRLLTLSFDPIRDKPEVMARLRQSFRHGQFDWRFLTCASATDLDPLLASYDQSIQFSEDEDGVISHVLRVYLIDPDMQVRNIYSAPFLHADTVLSDLKTVLAD